MDTRLYIYFSIKTKKCNKLDVFSTISPLIHCCRNILRSTSKLLSKNHKMTASPPLFGTIFINRICLVNI